MVKEGRKSCRAKRYIGTQWYGQVPRTDKNRPRYMHLAIVVDIEVRKCTIIDQNRPYMSMNIVHVGMLG